VLIQSDKRGVAVKLEATVLHFGRVNHNVYICSQTAHHFSRQIRALVEIVQTITLDCADRIRCDDHSSIIVGSRSALPRNRRLDPLKEKIEVGQSARIGPPG